MRVAFAGTPEFAAEALRALHAAGFELVLVLTQPDRPAGRGLQLHASPVKQLANALGIEVVQPRSVRLDGRYPDDAVAARQALAEACPDCLVVAAYGLILPPWVLAVPGLGCVNIHASLLPRWRGAAPIQRAIEAGDAQTGITIMQMDAGLDTGPMLMREVLAIAAEDTAGTLHDRLAALGGRMIVRALRALEAGESCATPQPAEGITYASKVEKGEARIDWRAPAEQIERRVRAFNPAPGATFEWRGESLKLWRARAVPGNQTPAAAPGAAVDIGPGRLAIGCGTGVLELLEVQRPGGRRMVASQYLQAIQGQRGARR